MKTILSLLTAICFGGCAFNTAHFTLVEKTAEGKVIKRISLKSTTGASLGSSTKVAKGHVSGYVDNKHVTVGQDVQEQTAGGDPVAIAATVAPLVKTGEAVATGGGSGGLGLLIRGAELWAGR